MSRQDEPAVVVDTLGLFCPAPIIRASEAMRNIASGGIIEVVSDDPAIDADLPAWCRSHGHTVLSRTVERGVFRFRVRRNR